LFLSVVKKVSSVSSSEGIEVHGLSAIIHGMTGQLEGRRMLLTTLLISESAIAIQVAGKMMGFVQLLSVACNPGLLSCS
jgi:CheY-specific phosphatase CheX